MNGLDAIRQIALVALLAPSVFAVVPTEKPLDAALARPLLDHLLKPREAIDLCGEEVWQYAKVLPDQNFDDPKIVWDTIRVPARVYYGGAKGKPNTAFYRRTFQLTEAQAKRHVELRFELAGEHVDVYVNGHLAGRSREWCLPFDVDATPFVTAGENRIDVRCWKDPACSDGKDWPVTFGWLTASYTGISRPVHLEISDRLRIRDVHVMPRVVGGMRLDVEAEIENETDEPQRVKVSAALTKGNEALQSLESAATEIPPRAVRTIRFGASTPQAQAWSPDSPVLYGLDLTLSRADAPTVARDAFRQRLGFTEVGIDGNRLLFNGHPMMNRRDSVSLGSCDNWKLNPSDKKMRQRVALYKKRGFVSMRCDVSTLVREARVCDEEGFLFSPLLPTGAGYNRHDAYWGNVSNMVAKAARCFRNHPSLLYWCLFNEFGKFYGVGSWKEQYPKMCAMGAWLKANDPTRFWTSCGDAELGVPDAGGEGPAPVRSLHYPVNMSWNGNFPEIAYWYANGRPSWQGLARRDKPLFISEDLYHGMNDVTWGMGRWGGDDVCTTEGYIRAWQDCIRGCVDGYYYGGVAEWNPWFLHTEQPTNALFSAGELIPTWHISRRQGYPNLSAEQEETDDLFVFNQSFTQRSVVLRRRDCFEGKEISASEERFMLGPGERKDLKLVLRPPASKGGQVKAYEVRFDLRAEDGAPLVSRCFAFNVIPEAKRMPQGIVLLVGGTNDCPLKALFPSARTFTRAEKAVAAAAKVVVCAGPLSREEGLAIDQYVQSGARAILLAGASGGWSPVQVRDRKAHSFAFRRDEAFLPDVPETFWRVWRPASDLGSLAIEKPGQCDAQILVDSCDSKGFGFADVVRVAQGRGEWIVTTLPIGERFHAEPAARYFVVRLAAWALSEPNRPSGGLAFLDDGHPFARAFRQDGFVKPVDLRRAKAVFADGSQGFTEQRTAKVLALAKAGATVFVTGVTTNGAASRLLEALGVKWRPIPPYVPKPGPGRVPPLDDFRRHWFARTSNRGLLAGLSNSDFFFETSVPLCNYFAWKAQGGGIVRTEEPPLVPGLFEGGTPLLEPVAMTEVRVGKGRVVLSVLPWDDLKKRYPARCLRIWRTLLGNAGVRTSGLLNPHRLVPIRFRGGVLAWDAPGRDPKLKVWFGKGDDMRYFPVNLCGWSVEADNKCPVEPFPAEPVNFGGIPFLLTPQDNRRGDAVGINIGIARSPDAAGTRLDRIWVLAALESDAGLKEGDVVVDALITNDHDLWHTAPARGAVAKYGVHLGAYNRAIPLSSGRIGWEGHSARLKTACLYVFAIENPFDKSIPVRQVFVRGGEKSLGKGKPDVAILGLTWQVD